MKKFFIIFGIFVVSALIAPWLVLDLPKCFKSEVPTKVEEKTKEKIDRNIASANDEAMDIIIKDLKGIEGIFSDNRAIVKEAKKLRTKAEILRKEIKKIQTDEQRLSVSKKVKEFSIRHECFIKRCVDAHIDMKKDEQEKPIKVEVRGVKEI